MKVSKLIQIVQTMVARFWVQSLYMYEFTMATTYIIFILRQRWNKINIINAILLLVKINGSFPIAEADPKTFKRKESNPRIKKPGRGYEHMTCHHSCALLVKGISTHCFPGSATGLSFRITSVDRMCHYIKSSSHDNYSDYSLHTYRAQDYAWCYAWPANIYFKLSILCTANYIHNCYLYLHNNVGFGLLPSDIDRETLILIFVRK